MSISVLFREVWLAAPMGEYWPICYLQLMESHALLVRKIVVCGDLSVEVLEHQTYFRHVHGSWYPMRWYLCGSVSPSTDFIADTNSIPQILRYQVII